MIIIFTYTEKGISFADFGVNPETDEIITMPPVTPASIGAIYDSDVEEWCLYDNNALNRTPENYDHYVHD